VDHGALLRETSSPTSLIIDITRSAPSGLLKRGVVRSVHRQLTVRVAWAGVVCDRGYRARSHSCDLEVS